MVIRVPPFGLPTLGSTLLISEGGREEEGDGGREGGRGWEGGGREGERGLIVFTCCCHGYQGVSETRIVLAYCQ